jgi:replicative DNA helicase
MGKTALGAQLAANVASRGCGVVYFSLEMPIMILHPRFVASRLWTPGHSSPSYQSILHGHVNETERRWAADVVAETSKWPLIIDDDAGLSAPEVEARARVYAARLKGMGSNLDLVVVDHLHKMHSPGAQNRVAEYSEVSAGLAEAAKRLDCPLIALAQLSRANESRDDKRPTLSDLRESGGLEQDADTVAFLYRPAYYLDRERPRDANADVNRLRGLSNCSHELEVILAKQRSGPIGTVKLWADMASNVIRDPSEVAA